MLPNSLYVEQKYAFTPLIYRIYAPFVPHFGVLLFSLPHCQESFVPLSNPFAPHRYKSRGSPVCHALMALVDGADQLPVPIHVFTDHVRALPPYLCHVAPAFLRPNPHPKKMHPTHGRTNLEQTSNKTPYFLGHCDKWGQSATNWDKSGQSATIWDKCRQLRTMWDNLGQSRTIADTKR